MLIGFICFGKTIGTTKMDSPITNKKISNAAYRLYAYLQEVKMEKENVYC